MANKLTAIVNGQNIYTGDNTPVVIETAALPTMNLLNLNDLAKEIYKNNVEKGFYDEPHSFSGRIALMHSELS